MLVSSAPALDGEPLLAFEHVTRSYVPIRTRRIERIFARFGGIVPEAGPLGIVDEDDDEQLDDDDESPRPSAGEAGHVALSDVSFAAAGGSCVALVGGEKAGKTLLLKMAAGMVPPTSGRVVVRGTVAPALDAVAALLPKAEPVGRALLSVAATMRIPPRRIRQRLPHIFEYLEAPELANANTTSLDTRFRRELLLATMLSLDPDVLLVDVALPRAPDPARARFVARARELVERGSLVVVASRDIRPVRDFVDRVVQLEAGAVVGDEPHDPAPYAARLIARGY